VRFECYNTNAQLRPLIGAMTKAINASDSWLQRHEAHRRQQAGRSCSRYGGMYLEGDRCV
jgi:hypothetical protein